MNKILKDITCRFQLLSGKRIDYRPGWDCHGLPIELKALQQRQLSRDAKSINGDSGLSALQTRALAKKLASQAVEEQKTEFKQWAVMADWENAWTTMDKAYELRQLEVLKSMLQKGLVRRRNKPVYWSPSSKTALAEAELEYNAEHVSDAAFVKFPLQDVPKPLVQHCESSSSSICAVVWTTTPWTLLANKAIAVNSDLNYVLVKAPDHGLLLLGQDRLDAIRPFLAEDSELDVLGVFPGSQLVGGTYLPVDTLARGPLPIVHAPFVEAGSGSGLVHLAPGHGHEDYKLCQGLDIAPFAPVDGDGRYTAEAFPSNPKLFEGLDVLGRGNQLVVEVLGERQRLLGAHKYVHKYPYDWRTKRPVIVRATPQWFSDVETVRGAALRSLEEVKFVPSYGKGTLESYINNRAEWCISRQRSWGVPLPVLYRKSDDFAVLTPESVDHIISVIRTRGIDAWWSDAESEPAWIPSFLGEPSEYTRGKDTMDVWFDSGTSWTELSAPNSSESRRQADVYLEGVDQHRGWFNSSLLTKIACQPASQAPAVAPFKTLVTHGFIVDERGRKMSKSEGNVVGPSRFMGGADPKPEKPKQGETGADALRLWASARDFREDVAVGDKAVQDAFGSLAKLRITFKYLLGVLDDYHPRPDPLPFSELDDIDKMALIHLDQLVSFALDDAYPSYNYCGVVTHLTSFVNSNLSARYLDMVKDRLYNDAAGSASRLHAQAVLWEVLRHLLRVASPLVPVLVEEVCDHLPAPLRFHPITGPADVREAPAVAGPWRDPALADDLPYLAAVRDGFSAARADAEADGRGGSTLQYAVAVEFPPPGPAGPAPLRRALERRRAVLADYLVVSQAAVFDAPHAPEVLQRAPWRYARACAAGGATATVHVCAVPWLKCERCWKHAPAEDAYMESSLCRRCLGVLDGMRGEQPEVLAGRPRVAEVARRCAQGSGMERYWGEDGA